MWGGPSSRYEYDSFSSVLEVVRRARDPYKGYSLMHNTKCRLVEGTLNDPKIVAVKLHHTDIVLFHADGSREIYVGGWLESVVTRDRIRVHGRVSIGNDWLPSLNGYRPKPERAPFLKCNGQTVPARSNGNYIRIQSDGKIDMATVLPYEVKFVAKPVELRRQMAHLGKVSRLLVGYFKLKGNYDEVWHAKVNVHDWLLERRHTKLEDIQLSPFPFIDDCNGLNDIKTGLKKACDRLRWDIAKEQGWIGTAEVWKPKSGS